MATGRSASDDLPAIEIDSEDDVEASGVGATRVDLRPSHWGWAAAGTAVVLMAAVVLGGGRQHRTQPIAPAPSTTVPTSPIPDERSMRVITFDGHGFAVTITMGQDVGPRNVAGLDLEGIGPSSHSYFFEVGACPDASTIGSVETTANPGGEFGAALEVRLQSDAPLWMRVVDEAGFRYAAARGRLYGPEFEFVEPSADPCSSSPPSGNLVDAPEQLIARRALMSPPHLDVPLISGADATEHLEPLTSGTRQVVLARFEDGETGLVVDPAWVVVDRAAITTVLGNFGTVPSSSAANVVRVLDARTGALELTFTGAPGPLTCAEPGAPSDLCSRDSAQSG